MNLRIDTAAVRGGGQQISSLTDSLASTMSLAEAAVSSAADNAGQPAVESALNDLLATLGSARPRVTMGLEAFAQEVRMAGEVFEQQESKLADAVPDAP